MAGEALSDRHDVLIVGGGHAGAQTAIALRQRGFDGSVALIGDDPHPPYERPPLSKEYLQGGRSFEQMLLRPEDYWPKSGVTLITGAAITDVDAGAHRVMLADGRRLGYAKLVWATGGQARRLTCEGHDLRGVHSVRSRADVDRLLSELSTVQRVSVIGGGFIGLEAAAGLTKLGKSVTLIETQDRVLSRVCGAEIGRFYEAEHRAHGVDVRTATAIDRIVPQTGRVGAVRLEGGEEIACDMTIVGIGIVPAIEPLRAAGASCDASVLVDHVGRTSLPDIYAVGDCASRPSVYALPHSMRIESVQNANFMATAAAADIVGAEATPEPVPWFWSNQYDLKLQTAGINAGHDSTTVLGDPGTRSFAVAYTVGGRLLAIDCVNQPKLFARGKKLITERVRLLPGRFDDIDAAMTMPAAL